MKDKIKILIVILKNGNKYIFEDCVLFIEKEKEFIEIGDDEENVFIFKNEIESLRMPNNDEHKENILNAGF